MCNKCSYNEVKVKVLSFSPVLLFATTWTVCSPPGSSFLGIVQARILEWISVPFSRDLPDPGLEPGSPASQADFYHLSHQESPYSKLKAAMTDLSSRVK